MYPKQKIIVRPITSNPVLINSLNQKNLNLEINKSLQLDVEKTKLEMQFLVDIERKKTETNKQIISQAFQETKEILNEVTHKKINFIQKQNEETTNQLIQLHQDEVQKLHQQYAKQIETLKQQFKLKEEELIYSYDTQLGQFKIQVQKNFDYQLEQYRKQFLKERSEINERHSWDVRRIKEKNEEQIKIIFDRLSQEYETKKNQEIYQLTCSYESKLDQQKLQLLYLQDQTVHLQNQYNETQQKISSQVNFQEKFNCNASIQTINQKEYRDIEIQTDLIVQEIQPLYCTNYEEIIQQNNQLKQQNYDASQELKTAVIELNKQQNEQQFLLELVMKYNNLFS